MTDSSRNPVTTVAVVSSLVLVASFMALYLGLRSDALTSNLMDGRYLSTNKSFRGPGRGSAQYCARDDPVWRLDLSRRATETSVGRYCCALCGLVFVEKN
ncbi:hypothetical protein VST63_19490 [Mycolicibacterium sp. 050232]|uniref:hypothetical protein n=1 Tax=Mycolicibacterium sp. 050232 TaxID=3113982 RepID=UPI002E27E6F2|nr:hypothetical protein [Mycolicibacterium sp. 050232]MED5814547.1 hypothetical protein [Mycolicibacterium sp. 050232]